MNLTKLFVSITVIGVSLSACTRHVHVHKDVHVYKHKPLPPGQAKKITGSKSAKPYAPGQQKKKK